MIIFPPSKDFVIVAHRSESGPDQMIIPVGRVEIRALEIIAGCALIVALKSVF